LLKIFVKLGFDIFCDKGNNPDYRIYVNNELFTERTYSWKGTKYIRENLQILAPPGEYKIHLEKLDKCKMLLRNISADRGPVEILDSTTFRITHNESS